MTLRLIRGGSEEDGNAGEGDSGDWESRDIRIARDDIARYRREGKGEIYDRGCQELERNERKYRRIETSARVVGISSLVGAGLIGLFGLTELGVSGVQRGRYFFSPDRTTQEATELRDRSFVNLTYGGIALGIALVGAVGTCASARFVIDWTVNKKGNNESRILNEGYRQGIDLRHRFYA